MVATPLSITTRYLPVGTRLWLWVPTITAGTHIPTRAEIDAGTDLTGEVVDGGVDGFAVTPATVDVPDAGSKFTGKIGGRISVDNSTIKLYCSDDSDDARSLLTPDLTGFVIIMQEGEYGEAAGKTMDIWPVTVLSNAIDQGMDNGGQMMVTFSITSTPALNAAIPAPAA